MSETLPMQIAVGDQVRVHLHPPCPMMSFVDGVISRIDAILHEETLIVVDVTREVILDRERPVRLGHQEYILRERWNDFPDQIELVSEGNQEVGTEHTPDLTSQDMPVETTTPASQVAPEDQEELKAEPEETSSLPQAQAEPREEAHQRSGLLAALFGRQR